MTEMHLSPQTYAALLDGTLPGSEARALAAHLESGCQACERWLAERPGDDRLDQAADAALAALSDSSAGIGDDVEFARIARRLSVESTPRLAAPRRLPWLAAAAALAVAGAAGLLLRAPTPAVWDGAKGAGPPVVALRLRFLVLLPGVGSPAGMEQGVPGQVVSAEASLQFQVELGREADVVLVRSAAGTVEPFFHARLPAGRSVISVAGQPAAYPLHQLTGRQRFLALAGEQAVEPAAVDQAARGAMTGPGPGQPISLDAIEVQIR